MLVFKCCKISETWLVACWILVGVIAVSYTHLDVYKRQIAKCLTSSASRITVSLSVTNWWVRPLGGRFKLCVLIYYEPL